MSDADEVQKWHNLFQSGAITEDEFLKKKEQILGISPSSGNESKDSIDPEIASLLVRLVSDWDKINNDFGPFRIWDESGAAEMDEALIWTEVYGSSYTGIQQGYFENETEVYYLAAQPSSDDLGAITTDAFFECEFCVDNDEDCPECGGTGLILIDIKAIVRDKKVDLNSAEAIWSQRSHG